MIIISLFLSSELFQSIHVLFLLKRKQGEKKQKNEGGGIDGKSKSENETKCSVLLSGATARKWAWATETTAPKKKKNNEKHPHLDSEVLCSLKKLERENDGYEEKTGEEEGKERKVFTYS